MPQVQPKKKERKKDNKQNKIKTINHFKVNNSVAFRMSDNPQPIWFQNIFITLKENPVSLSSFFSLSTCISSSATTNLQSVSRDLPSLDISYKWNQTICDLLWLTSFTWHNVFKVHPHCNMDYGCFILYIFVFKYSFSHTLGRVQIWSLIKKCLIQYRCTKMCLKGNICLNICHNILQISTVYRYCCLLFLSLSLFFFSFYGHTCGIWKFLTGVRVGL